MKTKLKFEDLKVGDVVVDNYNNKITIVFKAIDLVVCELPATKLTVCYGEGLDCKEIGLEGDHLLDYYKPTPTREDIIKELGGKEDWLSIGLDGVMYQPLTVIRKISALPPEKIKILFNIKD